MTLFAVACAGLFPILHMGRPWVGAYWLLPYPNTMGLWPNFKSPLIWDVFAVSTYATVSLLFWFVGLIPDLATLRDRAEHPVVKRIYGMLAMGWRGSARHWANYETAYLILAGLSTPLVVSVHTVVSFDFAIAQVPGWHATIFPPYFVAGAIYAGFAMVLTLAIPLRKAYGLEDFITTKHLENMGKVLLATSLIVVYGYAMEAFMAWYSGNTFERYMYWNRVSGHYWWAYWALLLCNLVTPQLMWFKRFRTSVGWLFFVAMVVNVGMWLERFVIVITSLHRDFLPSSWGIYTPTFWDWATFIGTMGLFLTLVLPVHPLPARDLDLRDADPRAGREDGREGGRVSRDGLYGLMAEFDSAAGIVKAAEAVHQAGYRKVDAYTPYPMEEVLDALHLHETCVPQVVLAGGHLRPPRRLRPAVLGVGDRVPDEHRRPADRLVAGVDRADLRDDRPLRVARRGLRHARALRLPPALPPGLQRARLRPRQPRPLLPRDRVGRPEVRPRRDAPVPARPRRRRGLGGAAVTKRLLLALPLAILAGVGVPAGHARPAEVQALARERDVRRPPLGAPARRGHRRPRLAARGRRPSSPAREATTSSPRSR